MYLYTLLGLDPDASPEAIRAAARRKGREAHPDRGGDPAAFLEVMRARDTLLNPDARRAYHREKGLAEPAGFESPEQPSPDNASEEAATFRQRNIWAERRRARGWALQLAYALRLGMLELPWVELLLYDSELAGEEMASERNSTPPQAGDDEGEDVYADEAKLPPLGPSSRVFARKLAEASHAAGDELDEFIRPALHNWRVERLATIDLLILRLAITELRQHPETPYRVVLNEYIEVAKDFGSSDTPRFVNGVLDNLARQVRPTEAVERAIKPPKKKKAPAPLTAPAAPLPAPVVPAYRKMRPSIFEPRVTKKKTDAPAPETDKKD